VRFSGNSVTPRAEVMLRGAVVNQTALWNLNVMLLLIRRFDVNAE
jgi:hypothetical protein